MFDALTCYGITARAFERQICQLQRINPRDFTSDSYHRVDDKAFGGGPGMVMKIEPLERALHVALTYQVNLDIQRPLRVYLSPQGKIVDQALINQLASQNGIIFVCGRYEGVDERFIEANIDLEISTGDYVVSGGEMPAMLVMDAIIRQLPGVVTDFASIDEDSFMHGLLDCPHYTVPRSYQGMDVPDVLLSGNHEQIRLWRLQMSLWRTYKRRPDLLKARTLTKIESRLLEAKLTESS
jgi:tRNA (guanine37-N1)-methyltransferase